MKRTSQLYKTKLNEGDEVIVLTGRSKGETGKIETIDRKKGRVYLAGKNLGKSHQKPDMNNHDGGIVDIPMPIAFSNVAIVDPKTKKASRIGYKIEGDKKVRISRASGTILDSNKS